MRTPEKHFRMAAPSIVPHSVPPVPHIAPDSFAAVIRAYLNSPKFAKLAPSTQANYRWLLKLAGSPDILGAVKVSVIRPALVQAFLDGLADRPGAQKNAKVALKAVERFALVRDLLPYPITTGTEVVGGGDGRRPWSEDQIEIATRHARPDLSRVIVLGASTGQRGSDLIKMRWSDVEIHDGRQGINVTQKKTGLRLWLPFTQALSTALAGWERLPGPILRRANGQPWTTRNLLSKSWELERDRNPELAACRPLVLHGLRASACVRLSRLGATTRQIADLVGMSEPMVARYCRHSVQRDNAMAAVYMLDGTPWQRPDQNSKFSTG